MRIKPPTLGEKIAMTITNDNAPIADASTPGPTIGAT